MPHTITPPPWACQGTHNPNPLAHAFTIFLIYFFIYWLHWVSIAVCGLSLIAASGGYCLLWCVGFSLQRLLLLLRKQKMGSRGVWNVVVVLLGLNNCGPLP